ncbi:MAG TPA: HAD hydrolase-like protein [Solirubrobacteraceae bacterium]|nr:HAD hydrolase-like protein [Solirubrobacteraceae bacterium]
MTTIEAIGFDLDMTLVDSRPVSRRALERLVSEYDAHLDIETLMSAYGLPLSRWLPPDVDGGLFRRLQAHHFGSAVPMPGADLALAAVRDIPARTVVVTSAPLAIAAGMLHACGLQVDRIRPGAWAAEKAEPIRAEGCWAYVGDHADDMLAARQAGVIAVGVRTGSSRPSGADIELEDLTAFPAWLKHRSRSTS